MTSKLGLFLIPVGGILLLGACTGKLSLGSNGSQSQAVAPGDVGGPVPVCDPGTAHPNVCCEAAPGAPSTCVVFPGAPFTACPSGSTTYPDPRSCCALDATGTCAPPPQDAGAPLDGGSADGGGGSGDGGTGWCGHACAPGFYAGATTGECCTSDGLTTSCSTAASYAPSCGGTGCACPACDPASSPGGCPCVCPTPPPCPTPVPTCGQCPPGWQAPQGDPTLCCTKDATGGIACFSQAQPGPVPTPVDAGPPTILDASPTPIDAGPPTVDASPPSTIGCGGSSGGQCGCSASLGGHSYQVNCDPGTNLCSCVVDNGAPASQFPDNGNTCVDPTALFGSCGFPTH